MLYSRCAHNSLTRFGRSYVKVQSATSIGCQAQSILPRPLALGFGFTCLRPGFSSADGPLKVMQARDSHHFPHPFTTGSHSLIGYAVMRYPSDYHRI